MRASPFFLLLCALFLAIGCTAEERKLNPTSSAVSTSGAGGAGATTSTSSGGGMGGSSSSTSSGGGMGGSGGGPECVDQAGCDDGDACTDDSCDAGTCTHTDVNVDDDDVCTTDACDPLTGPSHGAVSVDDADVCTTDACDPLTGPSHVAISVDDADLCTTDACDPVTGPSHVAISVDDANVCTTDACDPVTGPSHVNISVDDMNACTTDACDPVTGPSHVSFSVDDGNGCTTDACNPVFGPSHTPVAIDDSNACTVDSCDMATGAIGHMPVAIDDANPCTADACNVVSGAITHAPIYTPTAFRLLEVNIGNPDFLVLANNSACPNDPSGLRLFFDDAVGVDLTTVMPASVVPAGGILKVTETANPPAPDVYAGGNIPFTPTSGGALWLCNGVCTGATVIDAMAFGVGQVAPPLPAPVTFSPTGLSGVTSANQNRWSYHRVAYNGTAPALLASDWRAGTPCATPSFQIVEVNIGTPDYAVVQNTSVCSQNSNGYQMLFDDSSFTDATVVMPAQTFSPGENVRVTEGAPVGTDISAPAISFSNTRGGNTLLCNGSCAVGANVVDAMAWDGLMAHPALPSPVTFTSAAITGINTSALESTLSFVRTGQGGVAPGFLLSDWGTKAPCTSPTNLRFGELMIGSSDFVRIDNPGFCEVSLSGLQILFDDTSISDLTTVLPSQTLASRATVYVMDANAVAPNIASGGTGIPFSSTRGGAAILCNGVCAAGSSSNVLDIVAFSTGAPFPTLPTGATFGGGGLLGIASGTENTLSWQRAFANGVSPGFVGADWTLAAPSM